MYCPEDIACFNVEVCCNTQCRYNTLEQTIFRLGSFSVCPDGDHNILLVSVLK